MFAPWHPYRPKQKHEPKAFFGNGDPKQAQPRPGLRASIASCEARMMQA